MVRRLLKFEGVVAAAIAVSATTCPVAASEWESPAENTRPPATSEPIRDANEARRFAAHALALRAEIVGGGGRRVLARIPGASSRSASTGLWPAFFQNAIAAFGRLRSPNPAALYYNPLLDVAVTTVWERRDESWRVAVVRALPGEWLAGGRGVAPPMPSWLSSKDAPVEALAATAAARLDAFHRAHPPEAAEAVRTASKFAEEAAAARAALPRLRWHARQLGRWAAGAEPWLRPTLEAISAALSSGTAKAVMAAAPATDPATAQAVAGLPEGLTKRLVLDMVLEAGRKGRLLIGSLAEDGEMYFLVLCRLDGVACGLRRIVMVSLIDTGGAFGTAARR